MRKSRIILLCVTAFAVAVCCLTGCASCDRAKKGIVSNFGDGLNREIIVYDCIGNKVFEFKGKFDVDYTDERILFDDENNLRHVIYFKTGTAVINEVE